MRESEWRSTEVLNVSEKDVTDGFAQPVRAHSTGEAALRLIGRAVWLIVGPVLIASSYIAPLIIATGLVALALRGPSLVPYVAGPIVFAAAVPAVPIISSRLAAGVRTVPAAAGWALSDALSRRRSRLAMMSAIADAEAERSGSAGSMRCTDRSRRS